MLGASLGELVALRKLEASEVLRLRTSGGTIGIRNDHLVSLWSLDVPDVLRIGERSGKSGIQSARVDAVSGAIGDERGCLYDMFACLV